MPYYPKQLLIVCPTAFLEGWRGPTTRFFHIAKGLSEFGWETTILGASWPNGKKPNDAEKTFPGRVIRTPFPNGPHPRKFDRKGFRKLFRLGCKFLGLKKLYDDPREGWARRLTRPGIVRDILPQPDIIWAVSYGSVHSLAAARVLADNLRCPWTIEFHDPCPSPGMRLNTYEKIELDMCYSKCSGIIAVTETNANKIKADYPQVADKVYAVHLSFEEIENNKMQVNTQNQRLTLLHAGALYGGDGRNGRDVIRALKRCFDRHPELRNKILFQLLGGGNGAKEIVDLATEFEITDAIEVIDEVPSQEALIMMAKADVLLVIKFCDEKYNGQIPGKLFQYLAHRKPIIGLMNDCEAAKILRDSGLGLIVGNGDVEGLSEIILNLFIGWQHNNYELIPNTTYIKQYSIRDTSMKIDSILNNLLL